jgi:two-component system CheB/CheR fusion protein
LLINDMDPIHLRLDAVERGAWLDSVLDHARDFTIVLMDPEGRITSWPDSARSVFGYEAADVLGQRLAVLFTEEDQRAEVATHELAIARSAGSAHDDRWHVRKDGSRFWVSGEALALRGPDGALLGFAKLVRDRTDLRTQIDTLKNRLHTTADDRSRQDAMAATLAHELRGPLAPIANAVAIIRRAAGDAEQRVEYPLKVIERQLGFMQQLVDDLLDAERLRQGKLKLSFRRVVLQDAVEDAIGLVRPGALERRLRLDAIVPDGGLRLEVDPDRFQQIMLNLLGNAVKFTEPGGQVWVKITIETGHVAIRVEDTGRGIAPDLQPRLFDLFTQGEVEGARRDAGLGIGLALVKALVDLHNGTIAVRSEGPGKGSEFTVRLPLRQPGHEGTQAQASPDPAAGASGSPQTDEAE